MISTLEEVPPNWIKVKFEDIARNITKRIDKPAESCLDYYIGLEHLDTDQIRIKRFGSTDDVKATKFLCKKGDIIFGKRRAYLRKVAVTDRDAVVSAHSMVIRPKGDLVTPYFLPLFMQSSVFWKTAHAVSEGSLSPTIKWKTLAKQEFWIPSINEQKKIVEVLDSIEVNACINDKKIEILNVMKRGFLSKVMVEGIGHSHFKETAFGKIPEEWNLKKIKDICHVKTGGTPSTKVDEYWGGDIPWMSSGEIHKKVIYDTEQKITNDGLINSNAKIHPVNSVMIALNGQGKTRGTVAVIKIPTTCNQSLACLIPKDDKIDYLYLFYNLENRYQEIRNYTGDKGREGLNLKIVGDIMIPLPSLTEQKRIVEILKQMDDSLEIHLKLSKDQTMFKKKLTDDALSGRIIIPEEALRNVQ